MLQPDFDEGTIAELCRKHATSADYPQWLEKQIGLMQEAIAKVDASIPF